MNQSTYSTYETKLTYMQALRRLPEEFHGFDTPIEDPHGNPSSESRLFEFKDNNTFTLVDRNERAEIELFGDEDFKDKIKPILEKSLGRLILID